MGRDSAMAVVRASCMVTWPHSFRHARGAMRLFSASGSLILFPRLMVAMAERVTLTTIDPYHVVRRNTKYSVRFSVTATSETMHMCMGV